MSQAIRTSLPRTTCLLVLLTLAVLLYPAPRADALAPLAYNWSCTSRQCYFTVTTSNHGAYQWNFGDGTLSSKSTSKSAFHFYNTPIDNQFHTATVSLIGYATASSSSPDNIIGCTIVYAAASVGIGTSGSCS